jgi:alpha-L-arabinofuranosidase
MQTFFRESSGAMIHPITTSSSYSGSLAASAITWQNSENSFLRVKASKISCIKATLYMKGYRLV